ncbi:MAG: efflux RND transporter periplasmic adaptor subunit [Proteobacteria bacterium]|nr:efflux RND transporter periplasmic adaptor subunit [Pseudomonadota bacterium]
MRPTVIKVILPLLIIAVSAIGFRIIIALKEPPPKAHKEPGGALVQTMTVRSENKTVTVRGYGTVQPRMEANIVPQVSGKVVWVAPQFVAGGIFQQGRHLFRIEKIDYELAVEMARADLKKAEYELAKVESDARVARIQWEKWKRQKNNNDENTKEILLSPSPLVLYEPQLENARAQVDAARAFLSRAFLDLKRTRFEAPFNCMIRAESIDVGQYVRAGENLGQLFGTDMVEIVVPLSFQEMTWLEVPVGGSKKNKINAEVRLKAGSRVYTWPGVLNRSLGEVDAKGRMVKTVVQVKHPYSKSKTKNGTDLALGMFVEVSLFGKVLENVISVPRSALRDNNTVWLTGEDGSLHIQPVQYAWATDEEVWVTSGIKEGEKVVLTSLSGAVEGMRLRIVGQDTISVNNKEQEHGESHE